MPHPEHERIKITNPDDAVHQNFGIYYRNHHQNKPEVSYAVRFRTTKHIKKKSHKKNVNIN